MMKTQLRGIFAIAALAVAPATAFGAGLKGSPASMIHQHEIAVADGFSFLRTPDDVNRMVELGNLVPLASTPDMELARVSFPYARPVVMEFVTQLSARYRAELGAPLIVTSLMRPLDLQPRNAHRLSVHPAGMAIDFRIPRSAEARAWLEKTLLAMEEDGVLDVTRERSPAHYHVAVFPEQYEAAAAKYRAPATPPPAQPVADVVQRAVQLSTVASTDSTGFTLTAALLCLVAALGAVPFAISIRPLNPARRR